MDFLKKKGLVFTIDAFVALMLAVVTVYSLFLIYSVPESSGGAYMQAYYLAKDTLSALDEADCSGKTCLEQIGEAGLGASGGSVGGTPLDVAKAIIPEQYGFRFDVYDAQSGSWISAYDTATDPTSNHAKGMKKFEANAKSPVSGDSVMPSGMGGGNCGEGEVCAMPASTYNPGEIYVGLVRVSVYI